MAPEKKEQIEGFVCMIGDEHICQWKDIENDEITTQVLDHNNEVLLEIIEMYSQTNALAAKKEIIQKWNRIKKK